ncbi:MAG: FecR domain-containing protein [Acidobacteriia bacterium]|nr:FecR domain-containing protein [Terriglobia bacterium]
MTSFHCIRIALMTVVVLMFAAAQTAPPQQTVLPIGSAEISEVKGTVVLHSPQGSPLTAQRGVALTAGSTIETAKGSVLLDLQDGSQVLVKSHSNVVLKAPNEGKGYSLELLIGNILVKVQKRLGSTPSFRMGTPTAVITVRGTRFSVEVNKKSKTIVDVFEGLVEVAGVAEGAPHVLIRPGFSTGVERDRAPEQPREMNPDEGSRPEGGRGGDDYRGPGAGRDQGDQPQNQQRQEPPNQGEGKPD